MSTKQIMPRIHPIRWRADGYGTQIIWMQSAATAMLDARGFYTDGVHHPTHPIQRGYVKVWHMTNSGPVVIDRALSVSVARRRIEQHKLSLDKPN